MSSSKPKVFLTRNKKIIPQYIIDHLKESCDVKLWSGETPAPYEAMPRSELLKAVIGANAIFCCALDKIDSQVLDAAGPNLQVIATTSAGFDHIDIENCKRRGIRVGNAGGQCTDAVAEFAIALMLATGRQFLKWHNITMNGGYSLLSNFCTSGQDLTGATVGIVGLGSIGLAVARRVKPFEVQRILYCGSKPKPEATEIKAEFVTFNELLHQSDYVVICCSLNEATYEMFNRDAFSKMKSTSILINISRGPIINHDDLYDALSTGQINAAGLDVTVPEPLPAEHRLNTLDNCLISPHIAYCTKRSVNGMNMMAAENILAGLHGKPMPSQIC